MRNWKTVGPLFLAAYIRLHTKMFLVSWIQLQWTYLGPLRSNCALNSAFTEEEEKYRKKICYFGILLLFQQEGNISNWVIKMCWKPFSQKPIYYLLNLISISLFEPSLQKISLWPICFNGSESISAQFWHPPQVTIPYLECVDHYANLQWRSANPLSIVKDWIVWSEARIEHPSTILWKEWCTGIRTEVRTCENGHVFWREISLQLLGDCGTYGYGYEESTKCL